jgi:hypothetical protein
MAASLKLILTGAAGDDLNDNVTIDLFSLNSSSQYQVNLRVQREIVINKIDVSSGPTYRVMVSPANHRIIQFFTMLADGKTTEVAAAVPIDPLKVVSISAPAFASLDTKAQNTLNLAESPRFNNGAGGFLQGNALYTALGSYPLLKACYLNIMEKSRVTGLQDGSHCLDHYRGIVRFEQDRIFLRTSAALLEEVGQSNAFHIVSAALHEPMPGYTIVSSYKTFDQYGNLQLTFQRKGDTGNDYAADIDIDDAQGINHIFQVVRNSVNGPTNPYDIHDILLQQKPQVNPGYNFTFAAAGAVG